MEVRFLEQQEIPNAAGLSLYVFDNCLRNRMEFEQTIGFIEEYLTTEALTDKVEQGQLMLWGVYEMEELVGVSGMTTDGLITMIYILPQYVRRGMGSALLTAMRSYAKDSLGLDEVVVNATPAWTSTYFEGQGFAYEHRNMHVPFITMRAKSGVNPMFERKHVPSRVIVAAVLGCIALATVLCVGYVIWYTL